MWAAEGRRKTRKAGVREGGREGWCICCHGRRFSKQLLICLCSSAPPFLFFSSFAPTLPLALSPSRSLTVSLRPSIRQPFRQEICSLRVRLWTFLLQSFYAVRHTPGWESLSAKHQERILAGKENTFFTVFSRCVCAHVCGYGYISPHLPVLPSPPCPSLAPRQQLCIITDEPKPPRST